MILQAERKMSSLSVTVGDCRKLEMVAFQYVQQQAEAEQQRKEFEASIDRISQNAQQIQRQYTPRTVTCQHYQWGNMTSCTGF